MRVDRRAPCLAMLVHVLACSDEGETSGASGAGGAATETCAFSLTVDAVTPCPAPCHTIITDGAERGVCTSECDLAAPVCPS
jgi:hypothetical protein